MKEDIFNFSDKILFFDFDRFLKIFGLRILGAVILLFAGYWLMRFLRKIIQRIMIRQNIDQTVQLFVNQLSKWVSHIILFLAVIQQLGAPISSFLGVLTASAVAVGLAMQGSLSNFAGGIMLLIIKPFKVGDTIEAKGHRGEVKSIGMFYTRIVKFGNETLFIPNGPLFADNVINYSVNGRRRAKILVGISYHSDIKKAKEILYNIGKSNPFCIKEMEPVVYVEELADSSVNLSLRIWAENKDYSEMYFSLLEEIKTEFDKNNIEIPFPQQELYIKKLS